MGMAHKGNIVCDTPSPGIRVLRFVRPDLREHLYDKEATRDCSLYRELEEAALSDLAEGQTVILNFGLIDPFPTRFYSLLLQVREVAAARKARLLLCCFSANVRECFDLMGGSKKFEIRTTEANALSVAGNSDRK
jgi:hypothetical protein